MSGDDVLCQIHCTKCKKIGRICCDSGCHNEFTPARADQEGACLGHDMPRCRECCHGRPKEDVDCPKCSGTGKIKVFKDTKEEFNG